jgi:hypothetical protein
LGIELGADGVLPNDAGDEDNGANDLQNYPVLTGAQFDDGVTMLSGTFNGAPGATFAVDFYASAEADVSGFGEGQIYLRSGSITTDEAGNASFNVSLTGVRRGMVISATATSADGSTSEFSRVQAVPAAPTTFVWDGGGGSDLSWFNPLNWDLDRGVPGALDTAILRTSATIALPGSTLVGTLIQTQGRVEIASGIELRVIESFQWTGGSQTLFTRSFGEQPPGFLTIAPDATLELGAHRRSSFSGRP